MSPVELGRVHRAATAWPRHLVTGPPDPEVELAVTNEARRLIADLYQIARDEGRQVRRVILRLETEPTHRTEHAELTCEAYLSAPEQSNE